MNRAHLTDPRPWVRRMAWEERLINVRRSWPRWFSTRAANRKVDT